jgi:beta-glucanase (GH16 family)
MRLFLPYLRQAACALAATAFLSACGGAASSDSVPPTVAITAAAATGSDVQFSFAFSEALASNSFTAADIAVTGGNAGTFTMVDSSHAILLVSPTASTVSVAVAASKFDDVAHNLNTAAASANYVVPLPTVPTIAAPAPAARLAGDLISVYSDAYTTGVTSLDLFPKWSQTTVVSEVQIAGNKTQKYATFNYEGIGFDAVNITGMATLHVDIWTPDVTAVDIKIISAGPVEQAVNVPLAKSGWNAVDIDLSKYTTPNKAAINQLSMTASAPGGTLYFDNLYFYKPARALVWSDEFNSNGLPDSSKWAYDTYANKTGWFNNELQYYANARLQNSNVASGVLNLTAIKESLTSAADYGGQAYTSVRLTTLGKYSFTYGFVEVRAKLPCGQGTWPAIWMLAEATDNTGANPANTWPALGEIDIMEQRGITVPADKQTVLGTLHTTAHHAGDGITANTPLVDACTAFHNYQLTWTADRIQIGVDGLVYNTFDKPLNADSTVWPFNRPQYLLLNVAMGGVLGGNVPGSFVSDTMQVEYVRVYQ